MHRLAVRFADVHAAGHCSTTGTGACATELLVTAAIAALPACKPRELSTMAHTAAKLGSGPGSFIASNAYCSTLGRTSVHVHVRIFVLKGCPGATHDIMFMLRVVEELTHRCFAMDGWGQVLFAADDGAGECRSRPG